MDGNQTSDVHTEDVNFHVGKKGQSNTLSDMSGHLTCYQVSPVSHRLRDQHGQVRV